MSDMPDATVTDLPKRSRFGFVNKKNLGKAAALLGAGVLTGVFLTRGSKKCECSTEADGVEVTSTTDN